VTALVTGATAWAWGSVAASVVAGLVLLVDWFTRRTRPATDRNVLANLTRDTNQQLGGDTPAEPTVDRTESPFRRISRAEGLEPVTRQDPPAEPAQWPGSRPAGSPTAEPAEEDGDADTAIAVSDLDDEVVVIDEHPRYHLAGCEWVGGLEGMPLPVREARRLGFTPCAACAPDVSLVTRHRLGRR
jgi:hypothetical protein